MVRKTSRYVNRLSRSKRHMALAASAHADNRIRLSQKGVASPVVTRKRHGESETDYQRQKTEHCSLQCGDVSLSRDPQTKMMANLARDEERADAHQENGGKRVIC